MMKEFFFNNIKEILGVLLSGLAVPFVLKLFPNLFKEKKSNETSNASNNIVVESGNSAVSSDGSISVLGAQDITININEDKNREDKNRKEVVTPQLLSLNDRKAKIHILFIDDKINEFEIVKSIKRNEGWQNVKAVKDIMSLNNQDIIWAHIIFVDVIGVGTKLYPNDQGLGLAKGIKEKYRDKKVVIYSSEPKHEAFKEVWDIIDGKLPKNADPIQFYTKIENLSEEIAL